MITQSEFHSISGTNSMMPASSSRGSARRSPKRPATPAASSEPITIPAIGGMISPE